jgi:hypothetical protein
MWCRIPDRAAAAAERAAGGLATSSSAAEGEAEILVTDGNDRALCRTVSARRENVQPMAVGHGEAFADTRARGYETQHQGTLCRGPERMNDHTMGATLDAIVAAQYVIDRISLRPPQRVEREVSGAHERGRARLAVTLPPTAVVPWPRAARPPRPADLDGCSLPPGTRCGVRRAIRCRPAPSGAFARQGPGAGPTQRISATGAVSSRAAREGRAEPAATRCPCRVRVAELAV